jgi:8-oxo-dGTP diphosphatase
VIFSRKEELTKELYGLKVLLVRRGNHPSIGYWALPGGFVNMRENLEEAAKRELREETGVENLVMEQFATYGDYDRDPRTRVITTAYMALVHEEEVTVHAGDDAADAAWFEIALARDDSLRRVDRAGTETQWYRLHVWNHDKKVDTCALVKRTCCSGLIREEKFIVEDGGILAVDHAAILTQALVLLQDRLPA